MVDDVLVDRGARGDEDRDARALAPPGPPELLPGRGDRSRVAGQDRHVEPADVDAELERVRGDDAEDLAVAQAVLDRPPLRRQVAAAVAADPRCAARSSRAATRADPVSRISTATRDRPNTIVWRPARRNGSAQRWASVAAEPRAPLSGWRIGGSTRTTWRSPAGAPFRSMSRAGRPVSIAASSAGFPIVAEQQTMTGWLP